MKSGGWCGGHQAPLGPGSLVCGLCPHGSPRLLYLCTLCLVPGRRTWKGRGAGSWFGKGPTVCCSEEWARARQRGSKISIRPILKAGCPSLMHLPKVGSQNIYLLAPGPSWLRATPGGLTPCPSEHLTLGLRAEWRSNSPRDHPAGHSQAQDPCLGFGSFTAKQPSFSKEAQRAKPPEGPPSTTLPPGWGWLRGQWHP